ncbi:MAG: HK97 family phage prohead protease, partial [Epibacterium sp.]|nr:HK97 family phage prohead protease [Epibacterium sp.]NQX73926.1 HK97 family phage prohead protease [Epibacterium sp.]
MEYKAATFELKKEPDDDGTIEGYASVFDVVDNGMDVVRRGAFRQTLGQRKVR